jgi:hypothetical protein
VRHSRYTLAALAAVVAGSTQARADFVTYNMAGTLVSGFDLPLGLAVGDHIAWTLQYDNSTPMRSNPKSPGVVSGTPSQRVITNSRGFFIPSQFAGISVTTNSQLILSSNPPNGPSSYFSASDSILGVPGDPEFSYFAGVTLGFKGPLPTLNLMKLQLDKLPIDLSHSSFSYQYAVDLAPVDQTQFTASVDSISGPVTSAPEPGSLMLFLLGAAGFASHGVWHQLVSRPRLRSAR